MRSEAKTVSEYINSLPEDRKQAIEKIRKVVLDNLPKGIEENMNWGMIVYEVPLSVYPDTYNKQPLMFAALASQKNHMAVYLSGIYAHDELREKFIADYKETGKRMDLGKSCVRFRKIDDLPLDLVGKAISAMDMKEFINIYNEVTSKRSKK
jgi:uncharacterized protein YdhG (YjbR/CyaY superfamily)